MKTLNITLPKKTPLLLFSHAISPQWKPWEKEQPIKSPFLVEDFIADFFTRKINKPRRRKGV